MHFLKKTIGGITSQLTYDLRCRDVAINNDLRCHDVATNNDLRCHDVAINNDLRCHDVAIRQFSVKSFKDQLGVKIVQWYNGTADETRVTTCWLKKEKWSIILS